MNRENMLIAAVSAVIGAGIMLFAIGGIKPSGIEGWTAVNQEMRTALESQATLESSSTQSSGGTQQAGKRVQAGQTKQIEQSEQTGRNKQTDQSEQQFQDEQPGRISINTATADELQDIPGIGEKKALAIIEYRKVHGSFTSLSELSNVKGIGEKILEKMKPYIGL